MAIRSSRRRVPSAFTLVEILIVVVILGILATIVTAQLVGTTRDTKEVVLRENLRVVRTQLMAYRQLHGNPAGLDSQGNAVSSSVFVSQLVQFTDMDGNPVLNGDATHMIKPCLSSFPLNPMASTNDVKMVSGSPTITCDNTTAWIYNLDTQEFFANSTQYGPGGLNW